MGANLDILKIKDPYEGQENFAHVLSDQSTNFVLAACLKHKSQDAYQFAVELIAAGASFERVDLHQKENNQELGSLLVKIATSLNSTKAIERLNKLGFKLPVPSPVPPRSKAVTFSDPKQFTIADLSTKEDLKDTEQSKPSVLKTSKD
jgi:hypothetical protein